MAAVGFTYNALRVCNTTPETLELHCLDLQFLGMEKIACGDDFQALCTDWSRVNVRELFWSSFFAFVGHFYLIGSTAFAMQQRRSIPAILAQYRRPVPVEVVNGVLKSDSSDNIKRVDSNSSSNVRFTLPGKDRPESPLIFKAQTPVTTKTLMAGQSPDRSTVFSSLWDSEDEDDNDENDSEWARNTL